MHHIFFGIYLIKYKNEIYISEGIFLKTFLDILSPEI